MSKFIDYTVNPEPLYDLPYSFAKRHSVVVDDLQQVPVKVFYSASLKPAIVNEVQRFINQPVSFEVMAEEDFTTRLAQHYHNAENGTKALMDDLGESLEFSSLAEALPEPKDLLEADDDAPIIRLINVLLSQAIKENASDIHIETYESRMTVRFRVDGVLREVLQPPKSLAPLIISRVKVMSKMDIAEKRIPQDGRISLRVAGRSVDVRVSTLPSGNTERVVMRILDKQAGRLDLSHLGMAADAQQDLQQLIAKPHGIILVTGPTGSGKTTSLYAALTDLNQTSRNILTIEDPVEYDIDGIGQTQVNNKVDMTFSRGLRAILRQDPDVVMIGEIRDLETAEIAVQASLTGHLVLSTLHTNTAVGVVTRLRDMGVESYLLSSSLIGVIAQRLVRLLCSECRTPYIADEAELKLLRLPKEAGQATLHRAMGCEHCQQTGYTGRTGIYEVVSIDDQLRGLIHEGQGEQRLEKYARTQSTSIRQDGMRLVLEGRTTLEEVLRVTREDLM
ncbi:MAG: type II secretion system ATPase GspE [Thiotrichaceae bacterium]|nr:type II secretion system ATPase GspE [Thiotrichaceae bacterium]